MNGLARDGRGRWLPRRFDIMDPRGWDEPAACARIWLADGVWCWVDAEDYPRLAVCSWSLHTDGRSKRYARCRRIVQGRETTIYMHRLIASWMGRPPSRKHVLVDHRDSDGLNNRRGNLRWATPRENARNIGGWMRWQGDLFQPTASLL